MFEEVAQRFQVSLQGVLAVGDSLRDLEAAAGVGAKPVLVRTGKGQGTEDKGGLPNGTVVLDDLSAFAEEVLRGESFI